MNSALRVRVLLHEAGRTGVPVLLERLLEWARSGSGEPVEFDLVVRHGGALLPRLERWTSTTTVVEPGGRRSLSDAAAVGAALAGLPASTTDAIRSSRWRRLTRHLPRPDVVLVHGAGAWPLVRSVRSAAPIVLHLQELGVALDRSVPRPDQELMLRRCARVLTVGAEVSELARRRGAPADRIELLPGVADPHARTTLSEVAPNVVAAVGTPGWRKGADRFTALAHELGRTHPGTTCRWVGGAPGGTSSLAVGAEDPVEWAEATEDPWRHLADVAVLVVPSREDPLPLVALEAGQRGVPVVATESGGLNELLADGRGVVVPQGDLRALHRAVARMLDEPDGARRHGSALRARVEACHRVERVGPRWLRALRDAAAGTPPSAIEDGERLDA